MLRALEVSDFVIVEKASLELGRRLHAASPARPAPASRCWSTRSSSWSAGAPTPRWCARAPSAPSLSAEFEVEDRNSSRRLAGRGAISPAIPARCCPAQDIDRSGRSRCFINGHAATLAQLKAAGEHLIDIHGQHEHQSLLRPAAQRALLDAHAGAGGPRAARPRDAYRDWKRLQAVADEAEKNFAQREAERAELQDLVAGLEKALAARRRMAARCPPSTPACSTARACSAARSPRSKRWPRPRARALSQLAAVASRLTRAFGAR